MSVHVTPAEAVIDGADLAEQVGTSYTERYPHTERYWMIQAAAHNHAKTVIDDTVSIDFGFILDEEELSTLESIIAPKIYPKDVVLDVEGTVVTISSTMVD